VAFGELSRSTYFPGGMARMLGLDGKVYLFVRTTEFLACIAHKSLPVPNDVCRVRERLDHST
jgi:hypothetical protein